MLQLKSINTSATMLLTAALLLAIGGVCAAAPMDDEKLYELPERSTVIHPRLLELTAWGLRQPAKLTRLEALAEVRTNTFTELADEVTGLLDDADVEVQTTAIQAIEAIDARAAADKLLPRITVGRFPQAHAAEQAMLADTLLAKWNDKRAAPVWRKRLAERAAPTRLLESAARALGETPGEQPQQSFDTLREVLLDTAAPFGLRLAAADALARIGTLEDVPHLTFASNFLSGGTRDALLGARLLARANVANEIDILRQLAEHDEPAVAAIALQRLYELDPSYVWPMAPQAITRDDPKVRLVVVKSHETRRDPASIDILTLAINDPHPDVRTTAAEMLHTLAQHPSLSEPIKLAMRDVVKRALTEWKAGQPMTHWRAAEQAAILSGRLDDKPAYVNLMKLFDHPRHEVRVASIIGLRPLAVAETRQPVAKLMERVIESIVQHDAGLSKITEQEDPRLKQFHELILADSEYGAQIAQTLGVWRVTEADATLQRLIPKSSPASPYCRASAIWAIGLLRENQPDAKLAATLRQRLLDLNPTDPEADEVRLASVITIARMGNTEEVPTLKVRYRLDGLEIRSAARWGVKRLSGEELPAIKLEPSMLSTGFVSPIESRGQTPADTESNQ